MQRFKTLQKVQALKGRDSVLGSESFKPTFCYKTKISKCFVEPYPVVAIRRLNHLGELPVVQNFPDSTITPPIDVPCPHMNFVAECTTISAPCQRDGKGERGAKVLSTIKGTHSLLRLLKRLDIN